jgi:YcxB-like protein
VPSTTYTLTESDLIEAQRSWYLASLRTRATLVKLVCGIAIFGAAASIPLSSIRKGAAAGTLFFLVAYAGIILINWLLFARRARRSFLHDAALRKPITASWDAEEISFAGARRFGRTKWSDFDRRIESRSLVLLSRSTRQFNIVPKRAFDDGDGHDLKGRIERISP